MQLAVQNSPSKMKITLASALIGGVFIAVPTAQAATSHHTMKKSSIWYNAEQLSTQSVFAAPDGGHMTTYMPIYYVQQLLNQALNLDGTTDVWDGTNHTWQLTVNGASPSVISHGSGAGISVNGTIIENAPAIADVDPASGQETTFMPIWYVQQLVDQLLHLNSTTDNWNGSSAPEQWSLSTQAPPTLPGSTNATPQNSVEKQAAAIMNQITYKDEGQYRVFSAPIFTESNTWQLYIGMANATTHIPVPVEFSLDNGKTWHTAAAEYDSTDYTQGGVKSIPTGVSKVLVRGPKTDIAGMGVTELTKTAPIAISNLIIKVDGTRLVQWLDQSQ